MIFKSPEELVEFFNALDLDKSTLVFKESVAEEADCACKGCGPCQCPPEENLTESHMVTISTDSRIVVESFSDDPSYPLDISEDDHNIFYVKDYKAVENACGTGELTLEDRVSYMNMCEMAGEAKVNLNFVIEGTRFSNIPFTLHKTTGPVHLALSKKYLKQSD